MRKFNKRKALGITKIATGAAAYVATIVAGMVGSKKLYERHASWGKYLGSSMLLGSLIEVSAVAAAQLVVKGAADIRSANSDNTSDEDDEEDGGNVYVA